MEATLTFGMMRPMAMAAGTSYVQRSERRRHYEPPMPDPEPPKEPEKPKKREKKPRAKRRSAGFIYKFFTVLLGIILWPVGLIMLFPKYLRWKPFTKFLAACMLLACFVFFYGFLLTVDTGNADYARIQDTINLKIEAVAAQAADASAVVQDKFVEVRDGADNLWRAVSDVAGGKIADVVDRGVELSYAAREKIRELTGNEDLFVPEPTAEPTPKPTPEPTEIPADLSNIKVSVGSDTIVLPVYVPSQTLSPESGTGITDGKLTANGLIPSATIEPDISVDADIVRSYSVKSVGSAQVYCNIGSGQYYHSKVSCGSMKTSNPHTLKEALDAGMQPCERCDPVKAEMMDEPYVAWKDENSLVHTTDACESFKGNATVVTAGNAIDQGLKACTECDCDDYLNAVKRGDQINIVPAEQFS